MKKLLLLFLSVSLSSGNAFGMKRKRDLDDGGRPTKRRKKRKTSVYAQYLDENGWYCCPDCDYKRKLTDTFAKHLSSKRHGHFKGKEMRKMASIYDRYRKKGGIYHCPDCNYKNASEITFRSHISYRRHGHLKEEVKQKRQKTKKKQKKAKSIVEDVDALFEEIALRVEGLEQQETPDNLFYALSSTIERLS